MGKVSIKRISFIGAAMKTGKLGSGERSNTDWDPKAKVDNRQEYAKAAPARAAIARLRLEVILLFWVVLVAVFSAGGSNLCRYRRI